MIVSTSPRAFFSLVKPSCDIYTYIYRFERKYKKRLVFMLVSILALVIEPKVLSCTIASSMVWCVFEIVKNMTT